VAELPDGGYLGDGYVVEDAQGADDRGREQQATEIELGRERQHVDCLVRR
jgi:hypothetical protein